MALEIIVRNSQSGQKIFNFIKRLYQTENNEIHRWIRTGQVRINKKRCKAFDIVQEGDSIRIPPFAQSLQTQISQKETTKKKFPFPIIFENEHILVINKPQGIACQGGTNQKTNIADILKDFYQEADFIPSPAHRIDSQTQGLLFIGKSYQGLRFLTDFFKGDTISISQAPKKYYLAWVYGNISQFIQKNTILCDYLYHNEKKQKEESFQSIAIKNHNELINKFENLPQQISMSNNEKALLALSTLELLEIKENKSLVKIGIYTGRKHQIRVQLARAGFSLVGDKKYAPKKQFKETDTFFLQAFQVILPKNAYTEQTIFKI